MRKHLPPIAALLVVLVALLAAYAGAYWLLLDHEATDLIHLTNYRGSNHGLWGEMPACEYKAGGEVAKAVFWPANQIDRAIRLRHWQGDFAD